MKTKACPDNVREGRLKKARSFLKAANLISEFDEDEDDIDTIVSLCVLAGIAAADVLCCGRLGVHAQGQDHSEAVSLLKKVDKKLANDLARLLQMKTRSGYGFDTSSAATAKATMRQATRLVDAAQRI